MTKTSFSQLLRRIRREHFASVNQFAERLGVAPAHLSRMMGRGGHAFDVYICLRLAELVGEDPGTILRAAGRGEFAAQCERLWGKAAKPAAMSVRAREMHKLWAAAEPSKNPDIQKILDTVLAMLRWAEEATKEDGGNNSQKRSTTRTKRTA